jgi:hypothetical protein
MYWLYYDWLSHFTKKYNLCNMIKITPLTLIFFKLFCFPIVGLWAYPMKVIPESLYTLNLILSLGQYLCRWTISLRVYHPPSSVWKLTWFIRYIYKTMYYWILQFINNVIIITTKVFIRPTEVKLAEFGYTVYALWYSWS